MPDPGLAQPALPPEADRPPLDARATTSTSRSARATCRRTRCRWRSVYAAIANGGKVRPPASRRRRWRASPARSWRRCGPGARAPSRSPRRPTTTIMAGPHRAAMEDGRHLLSGLRQLPVPGRRQDRNGRARRHAARTSPGTSSWRPADDPGDRGRGDDRARRLRRGRGRSGGRPHPREVLQAADHARDVLRDQPGHAQE